MTTSITGAMCAQSPPSLANGRRRSQGPDGRRDVNPTHRHGFPRLAAASFLLAALFATLLAPRPALAQAGLTTIAGKVWRDLDRNGLRENEEVTLGVAGCTMELWNHDASQLLATTQTDADGNYTLSTYVAPARIVRVRVVYSASSFTLAPKGVGSNPHIDSDFNTTGEFASFTDPFTAVANGTITGVDAGLDPVDVQVGNFTWLDVNANGIQDAGEPGFPGIQVEIWNEARTVRYDTAISSPAGNYGVAAPGYWRYRLKFSQPDGATFTLRDAGTDDLRDSDVIASGVDTGWTPTIEFPPNVIGTTANDAGYVVPQAVDASVAYENVHS